MWLGWVAWCYIRRGCALDRCLKPCALSGGVQCVGCPHGGCRRACSILCCGHASAQAAFGPRLELADQLLFHAPRPPATLPALQSDFMPEKEEEEALRRENQLLGNRSMTQRRVHLACSLACPPCFILAFAGSCC